MNLLSDFLVASVTETLALHVMSEVAAPNRSMRIWKKGAFNYSLFIVLVDPKPMTADGHRFRTAEDELPFLRLARANRHVTAHHYNRISRFSSFPPSLGMTPWPCVSNRFAIAIVNKSEMRLSIPTTIQVASTNFTSDRNKWSQLLRLQ